MKMIVQSTATSAQIPRKGHKAAYLSGNEKESRLNYEINKTNLITIEGVGGRLQKKSTYIEKMWVLQTFKNIFFHLKFMHSSQCAFTCEYFNLKNHVKCKQFCK